MSNVLVLTFSRRQATAHPRWKKGLTKVELELPWDQGQGEDYLKLFFNFSLLNANAFLTSLRQAGVSNIIFQVDPATEPF